MRVLFILFLIVPIVEMVILIKVGSIIGALNTIGFVVLTAFVGVTLLKRQGVNTLLRASSKLNSGEVPAKEFVEGLMLAVGGALLLTPGFVTDAFGLSLLIPQFRSLIINKVIANMSVQTFQNSGQHYYHYTNQQGRTSQQGQTYQQGERAYHETEAHGNVIIEGEFQREGSATQERTTQERSAHDSSRQDDALIDGNNEKK